MTTMARDSAFRRLFGIIPAMVLAVTATACGPSTTETESTADSHDRARMAPPPVITVTLPGEPATEYRTRSGPNAPDRVSRRLQERFPDLRVDPCLKRAAGVYGRTSRADDLPLGFSEFLLHWAGCPDPFAAVIHVLTNDDGEDDLVDYIDTLDDLDATHIGVARLPAAPPYSWRWTAFLVNRRFEIQPVPTNGEPGSSVVLVVRLLDQVEGASVITTRPDGTVVENEVGLSQGRLLAAVELARRPGTQWIEVMATDHRGPHVVALFPIEVGRPPPRAWVGKPRDLETWITDPNLAEHHAMSLLQADRARFGLPPLQPDETLSTIARRHSAEMAATDRVAHFSPTTGTVADRLTAARYRVDLVAENIARSSTIADAQDGLMRSPSHRAAILDTAATHVGIGVVSRDDPATGRVHYLTQIFARPAASPGATSRLQSRP
jgi:hypothetical protein